MPTAVLIGANSGIAHEFAKVLINHGWDVYATDVEDGEMLKSLDCKTFKLDVTSQQSINNFKQQLEDIPLDLLLNIAGIKDKEHDSLSTINEQSLSRVFAVNAYGPLLLTQALLPNLLKSASPRLGFISSLAGSIGKNNGGSRYSYRASKTALNMICKSLSVDLKDEGVMVVIMHPGRVRTAMTPEIHDWPDAMDPNEAAEKLYELLMSRKLEDTGKFWHIEGHELPW